MISGSEFNFNLLIIALVLSILASFAFAQLTVMGPGDIVVQCDTTEGYFGIGNTDGYRILFDYNYPWTPGRASSHFVLRIDDTLITNATWLAECDFVPAGRHMIESRVIGNTITTLWEIPFGGGEFLVRQNLTATSHDTLGMVRVNYFIYNNDNSLHYVGLLLNFDLLVAGRDDAPVAIGFDYTPVGRVFSGDRIPYFWQAYQIGPAARHTQVIGRGFLRGMGTINPDHFAIGREYDFYYLCWDFDSSSIEGLTYHDSGLLLRWDQTPLPAQKSIEYTTFIGLGSSVEVSEGLTLIPITPSALGGCDCRLSPNPFESSCLVVNTGYLTYENIQVCIEIPPELRTYGDYYHPPELCHELNPPTLTPEGIGATAWLIEIDSAEYSSDTVISIVYRINSGSHPLDTIYDTLSVNIPIISGEPPRATLLGPSGYASCTSGESIPIKILLYEEEGIDTFNLRVKVGPYLFDYFGRELEMRGDTLLVHIPDLFFTNGRVINYQLMRCTDIFGCTCPDSIRDSLIIDLEGPLISGQNPPDGSVVSDSFQRVSVVIFDSLSGVDRTSCVITVNGVPYRYHNPEISWEGSTMVYTPSIPYPDRSTVVVCITEAHDSPDYCLPNNIGSYCRWDFSVDYTNISESTKTMVESFELLQPFPNPFNEEIHWIITLPAGQFVEFSIFNLRGEKLLTLLEGYTKGGVHRIPWRGIDRNGLTVPSGIYLGVLKGETQTRIRAVICLK
ncbi:hypothetical protein JW877_01230 [bacterium]|nr:hypothetical protein [bacterium]